MQKRFLTAVAVLAVASLLLTGCAAPASAPAAPAAEATATEAAAAEATATEAAATEAAATEAAATEAAATEAAATEAAAAAGACTPGEGSIAVLLPDSQSSARWENDDRKYFEEAFAAAGVEFSIVNAEGDAAAQQTQAEQALTNGAKVVLLVNLDSGSGASIIAKAKEAGARVIDYDRLTIDTDNPASVYVSFDNVAVGKAMGDTLEPLINALGKSPARVVQLNGSPTDNNATLFREGYFGVAKPHYDDGSWELVADQAVPQWDNQQALTIFQQILTDAGNDVNAVFAANDGLANSVISALKTAGLEPMPVSGQDATVAGIQNVLSGWQSMSVYKPIKAEADAAAKAAIALLNCEDAGALAEGNVLNNGVVDVPFIKLTPIAVTKDNIKETVITDGFRTWEELCVGDFEQYCPPADQR